MDAANAITINRQIAGAGKRGDKVAPLSSMFIKARSRSDSP